MTRMFWLVIAASLVLGNAAAAQRATGPYEGVSRYHPAPLEPQSDRADRLQALRRSIVSESKQSYWVRGGLIGAGIGAAGVGALAAMYCSAGDGSCSGAAIGGAVLGAGLGFLTGALIGGAFTKESPVD